MICDETLAGKVGQQLPRVLGQKTADVAKEIDRLGPTGPVNGIGMSCLTAQSANIAAKTRARSDASPTTMYEECGLSCSALPSHKNSGEKIRLSQPVRAGIRTVNPTRMVDLITAVAGGLI